VFGHAARIVQRSAPSGFQAVRFPAIRPAAQATAVLLFSRHGVPASEAASGAQRVELSDGCHFSSEKNIDAVKTNFINFNRSSLSIQFCAVFDCGNLFRPVTVIFSPDLLVQCIPEDLSQRFKHALPQVPICFLMHRSG
jgi:hypothetical protein